MSGVFIGLVCFKIGGLWACIFNMSPKAQKSVSFSNNTGWRRCQFLLRVEVIIQGGGGVIMFSCFLKKVVSIRIM